MSPITSSVSNAPEHKFGLLLTDEAPGGTLGDEHRAGDDTVVADHGIAAEDHAGINGDRLPMVG